MTATLLRRAHEKLGTVRCGSSVRGSVGPSLTKRQAREVVQLATGSDENGSLTCPDRDRQARHRRRPGERTSIRRVGPFTVLTRTSRFGGRARSALQHTPSRSVSAYPGRRSCRSSGYGDRRISVSLSVAWTPTERRVSGVDGNTSDEQHIRARTSRHPAGDRSPDIVRLAMLIARAQYRLRPGGRAYNGRQDGCPASNEYGIDVEIVR